MSAARFVAIALLLIFGHGGAPASGEPVAGSGEALSTLPLTAAPPRDLVDGPGGSSLGQASLRLLGAGVTVGLLMAVTLLALRRLLRPAGASRLPAMPGGRRSWFQRSAPVSPLDHVEVVERRALGPKESVCVVKVGSERFLIGVTSSQVSLLGRLDGARATARDAEEPAPSDFARELAGAAVPRHPSTGPVLTEATVQALLNRSRERLERLARLGTEAGRAGGPRV